LRQALTLTGQPSPLEASASQQWLSLSQQVDGAGSRPAPGTLLVRHQMSFLKKPAIPYGLVWAPDSSLLAALAVPMGGGPGLLYLWETSGHIHSLYQALGTSGAALAWVPGSSRLSFLEGSTQIVASLLKLWNVTTAHIDDELVAGITVYALAWAPDGSRVAFADDYAVTVYGGASYQMLVGYPQAVPAGGQPSYFVAWSPDGKTIASAGHTHAVQFWEAATGRPLHYFPEQTKALAAVWSPDGQALAYLAGTVSLQSWNQPQPLRLVVRQADSGQLLLSQPALYPAVAPARSEIPLLLRGLAWSPSSRWLATAGQGEMVQVWEIARRRLALTYRGHRAPVLAVAWSPDGEWLASASSDGEVHVWKAP
jgi:WD40 repeat protein